MSLQSVREFFVARNLDIPIIELEVSTATVALAAEAHGVEPGRIAKTLSFRLGDGSTILPSSLDGAFVLDGPGEYEVKEVLVTGVRTYRDDVRGAEAGKGVSFAVEVDGIHTIHLGEIGHLLTEEKLGDIGSVDIACVPLGGALSPTKAAALVAQLDPKIVIPMTLFDDDADCAEALAKFFHEMGAEPTTQPKLSVTMSSLPMETTTVLLESRGKQV